MAAIDVGSRTAELGVVGVGGEVCFMDVVVEAVDVEGIVDDVVDVEGIVDDAVDGAPVDVVEEDVGSGEF